MVGRLLVFLGPVLAYLRLILILLVTFCLPTTIWLSIRMRTATSTRIINRLVGIV